MKAWMMGLCMAFALASSPARAEVVCTGTFDDGVEWSWQSDSSTIETYIGLMAWCMAQGGSYGPEAREGLDMLIEWEIEMNFGF